MTEPTIGEYTETTLNGDGIFDTMMRGVKAHLEDEFSKNRIKGPEYSSVYLGAMQSVMEYALRFQLEKEQAHWRAELLKEQTTSEQKNQLLLDKQLLKLDAEISNIGKQGELLDEQIASEAKQNELGGILDSQRDQLVAQTALSEQQKTNLETDNLQTMAQTSLIDQQKANALTENDVMLKQICKLEAEFDVLMEQKLKTVQETALLTQKKATEAAQTSGLNVDDASVLGRQKLLYKAQTDGFFRDAEQKAAKLMVDTWNVRRTTDVGTLANIDNKLSDADVGSAVSKLLSGVNA